MAGEQGGNLKAKETDVDELVDLARRACAPQITASQISSKEEETEEDVDKRVALLRRSVPWAKKGGLAWPTTELDSSWRKLNNFQAEMQGVAEVASPVIHPPSEEAKNISPVEMTIGNRTYEVLSFFRNRERFVRGWVMVNRANEMNAHLGEDDGQYILNHQDKIPFAFRNFIFVFTNWRRPDDSEDVYYICWDGDRWVQGWAWLDGSCDGYCRVLRRKLETLEA